MQEGLCRKLRLEELRVVVTPSAIPDQPISRGHVMSIFGLEVVCDLPSKAQNFEVRSAQLETLGGAIIFSTNLQP